MNNNRNELVEKGLAFEIKEDFLLFHTLDPKRQELESFDEYKFRQKITRKTIRKMKKK